MNVKELDLTNNINIVQRFCPIENPDEINLSDEILPYSTAVKEKRNIVHQPTNEFSLKVGGTYFDVSTHFDTNGRQSVIQQFKDLILLTQAI